MTEQATDPSFDPERLIALLAEAGVRVVLIGGFAAITHGASRYTYDIDFIYERNPENIRKLVRALTPLNPYPRGAPVGLPFIFDEETITKGLNFTFATKMGPVNFLGEAEGAGDFDALYHRAVVAEIGGVEVRVANLPDLIRMKRAAGRPKDFEALAELEILLGMQSGRD
jgi:hypothetical protein